MMLALNTLHTKIFGYVILHCDLHLGQVMRRSDGSFVLIDFDLMAVHKKTPTDDQASLEGRIFHASKHFCRPAPGSKLYGISNNWHHLGMLLYDAAAGLQGQGRYPDHTHSIYAGANHECDLHCAAKKNLQKMDETLQPLMSLLLSQDVTTDKVLRFIGSEETAAQIPISHPSTEFHEYFKAKVSGGGHHASSSGATPTPPSSAPRDAYSIFVVVLFTLFLFM